MAKIYCAGPLFNDAERHEMESIAKHLEQSGHSVFLPHRDGLEFSRVQPSLIHEGFDPKRAEGILAQAIFALDIYKLLVESDAVVVNLNGRVPDEGTLIEAALAWHSGKVVILYKNDARSLLNGSDNPMITGLGDFSIVSEIEALPALLDSELLRDRKHKIEKTLSLGHELSVARGLSSNAENITKFLLERFHKK